MKKEPVLVIMAAGMGSRFGGLKQIEPVSDKGELIIDFSLYDAVMAGFKKAIFVIKKENEGKTLEQRLRYQRGYCPIHRRSRPRARPLPGPPRRAGLHGPHHHARARGAAPCRRAWPPSCRAAQHLRRGRGRPIRHRGGHRGCPLAG